jgi:hypothetical protein
VVLAPCRGSCFCFSHIAPVFHPSTSHVHEQGTGLQDIIGEAPVAHPCAVSWCVPFWPTVAGLLGTVSRMYLFWPVLVWVHLCTVRTSLEDPCGADTYSVCLLPTGHGDRRIAQRGWTALERTVLWTCLFLAGHERPCALPPQHPKTRQIAPRLSHPRPAFPSCLLNLSPWIDPFCRPTWTIVPFFPSLPLQPV